MNPTHLDNLHEELAQLIGAANLTYAAGYTEKGEVADEALIQEALEVAGKADVVVICAGLTDIYEVEGLDRQHLRLPAGHEALIQRLATAHQKVVVVLSNGSPVEMPWVKEVSAILEGYLGGQAGAGAIADILTGKVNPSGKLAETFPLRLADTPAQPYPGGPATVEYRESLYVGYRWYDTAKVEVLFPFGYGLSYTSFAYRDLALKRDDAVVTVTFKVKNTGAVAGKEVAQLYVRDVQSTAFRPDKELRGFVKVELQPGEETEVTLTLERRAFAYYDVGSQDWVVEAGDFEILVGASSRDIRLTTLLHIATGSGTPSPVDKAKLASYYSPLQNRRFGKAEFETLLGHPAPENVMPQKGSYDLNTPLCEMRGSLIGRQLFNLLSKQMCKMVEGKEDTPMGMLMLAMVNEMPLRTILMMGGPLNRPKLEALLLIINGHVLKGLAALIRSR